MTHPEQHIVEFFIASNPAEMADLPDWFFTLVEADGGEKTRHEVITAAAFLLIRRDGRRLSSTPSRGSHYAADPAKLEALSAKINAFCVRVQAPEASRPL